MRNTQIFLLVWLTGLASACVKLRPAPNSAFQQCVPCTTAKERQMVEHALAQARFAFGLFTVSPTCCPSTAATTAVPMMGSCNKCGIKKSGTRIVGGVETQVNEYPWMALLVKDNDFFCGGSLVSAQFVITAAHCMYDAAGQLQPGQITVVLGEHDINSDTETTIRKAFEVENVIIHPEYDGPTFNNDIAVLKLREKADLSIYTPVCIPLSSFDPTGKTGTATGWGTTVFFGSTSNVLLEADLTIVSDAVCRNSFQGTGAQDVTDQMVCAGAPGKDTCQGDSGGPLNVADNGQFLLVGITSWGFGCAQPDTYGVYAEVAKLRGWINQQFEMNGGATFCGARG